MVTVTRHSNTEGAEEPNLDLSSLSLTDDLIRKLKAEFLVVFCYFYLGNCKEKSV